MPESSLQVVDRPAGFEPIDGVPVAQVVEAEGPKVRFLEAGLLASSIARAC